MKIYKISKAIVLLIIALISVNTSAQTKMKEVKAGHIFNISLPEYMNKTAGLNGYSSIEYKNDVKRVYGIIIYDLKEDLKLVGISFPSAKEFCDNFVNDFFREVEKKSISNAVSKKIDEANFIEKDIVYLDKESNVEIYYLIGIVETKTAFYKVLAWSENKDKDKFKGDFQKILYSLKD